MRRRRLARGRPSSTIVPLIVHRLDGPAERLKPRTRTHALADQLSDRLWERVRFGCPSTTVRSPAAATRARNGPNRRQMRRMPCLDKYRRLLTSGQVGSCMSRKALDLRVHERLAFPGVASDVAILRQKRPSAPSDGSQERLVVGGAVVREHFNGRAGVSQGFRNQPASEVVIEQEDEPIVDAFSCLWSSVPRYWTVGFVRSGVDRPLPTRSPHTKNRRFCHGGCLARKTRRTHW